jgi:hypothetical protein
MSPSPRKLRPKASPLQIASTSSRITRQNPSPKLRSDTNTFTPRKTRRNASPETMGESSSSSRGFSTPKKPRRSSSPKEDKVKSSAIIKDLSPRRTRNQASQETKTESKDIVASTLRTRITLQNAEESANQGVPDLRRALRLSTKLKEELVTPKKRGLPESKLATTPISANKLSVTPKKRLTSKIAPETVSSTSDNLLSPISEAKSTSTWRFNSIGVPQCPLPCRESQFEEIWTFMNENITQKTSRYIQSL